MSENLTRAVRRMALDGSEAPAIAVALDCEVRTVQGLIWRMRQRGELPAPVAGINPKALQGHMLKLLEHYAPHPISGQAIRRSLGCGLAAYRRAIDRLIEVGAARFDDAGLVYFRSASAAIEIGSEPSPEPEPEAAAAARARLLHAAVLRRAWALVKSDDRQGAVTLLNRAAERSSEFVAINFLALGDLIGAGHSRYPEISDADAERLRVDAGFIAGAEVRAALASEACA